MLRIGALFPPEENRTCESNLCRVGDHTIRKIALANLICAELEIALLEKSHVRI